MSPLLNSPILQPIDIIHYFLLSRTPLNNILQLSHLLIGTNAISIYLGIMNDITKNIFLGKHECNNLIPTYNNEN